MAKVDKSCIECGESKTKKAKARDFYLCEICSELDKYKLIYKTHIKNKYFITENELEEYDNYIVKQDRGYPNMTLYKISDVKDVFCSKYKINRNNNFAIVNKMNNLQEEKERKSIERKERIKKNKKDRANKRKIKLVKALKDYGLTLRKDSKLCCGYIDGTIKDWSIKEIVQRMCQMKYLYEYCNMNDCYQKAYDDQQRELNAGYFPDCTVFERAEMIALNTYGEYPTVWPWLKA